MEGNGSYNVAESSFCCFMSCGSFYSSFDRHKSLSVTANPYLLSNHLGEDYNSQKATLLSLGSTSSGSCILSKDAFQMSFMHCEQGLSRTALSCVRVVSISGEARLSEPHLCAWLARKPAVSGPARRSRPSVLVSMTTGGGPGRLAGRARRGARQFREGRSGEDGRRER